MRKEEKKRLDKIYKSSKLKPPYTNQSLAHRFWVFQNERVPLIVMLAIGLSISVTLSKSSGNINWYATIIATLMIVLYFLQIRLADEPKDYEHDNQYYPNRPVQRGVITLKELSQLKTTSITCFFVLAALTGSIEVFLLACLQQLYSYLTRHEFFMRNWLRKHFLIYQFSHYIQLLILDWLILSVLRIQPLSQKLLFFVFIIIMIGMVEASRTIGGTDGKAAKDRYSYILGINLALGSFVFLTIASAAYTAYLINHLVGNTKWFILIIGLTLVAWSVIKYKAKPTIKNAEIMNGTSLVMYLLAALTLYLK